MLFRKLNAWRFRTAVRLIQFCLDYRVDNQIILGAVMWLYALLLRNAYVLEHKPARHHYIPRFLLQKFRIPPNTGLVNEYTHSEPVRRASIKKEAACIPNLYSVKDKFTKGQSDFLETYVFARSLERFGSRIINRLLEEPINLTNLEESILSSLIAFQYVRTPKFFYLVRLMLEYLHLGKGIQLEAMLHPDFYRKAFFENHYDITPGECLRFAAVNKLRMDGANDLIWGICMRIGNDLSGFIHAMNLNVLNAVSPAYFFLSDSPAEIFNLRRGRSVGPFLWELQEQSLVFMPITPSACAYYMEGSAAPSIIGAVLRRAIPDSIHEHAYSDREDPGITSYLRRR